MDPLAKLRRLDSAGGHWPPGRTPRIVPPTSGGQPRLAVSGPERIIVPPGGFRPRPDQVSPGQTRQIGQIAAFHSMNPFTVDASFRH